MDVNQLSWATWSVADLRETSAALRPGADPKGGWTADMISPAGTLVRNELRTKNPPPTTRPARALGTRGSAE
jgi:hypothetical protein